MKQPRKGPTPKRDRSHEAILGQASLLFATQGFTETSADAIAEASGVSKPTLYRRFPSKMAMLTAIRERNFLGLIALSEGIMARECSDLEKLQGLFEGHLRYSLDHRQDFLTLLNEHKHLMDCVPGADHSAIYIALLRDLLGRLAAQGVLRDGIEIEMLLRSYLAFANWPILWFREGGGELTIQQLVDQCWTILLQGALSGN